VIGVALVHRPERGLLGTEVPEVVPGHHEDAVLAPTLLQRGNARHDRKEIPGLEHHVRTIGSAPERRRQLHLP
jgi:hypothetical protein